MDRIADQGGQAGVVRLLYPHTRAEPPCLEYEYVEGGDLAGFVGELRRRGQQDPILAAKIVCRVAKTVGFMHRLEEAIVHRDLKPANILVRREEQGRLDFKVADFGIGAVLDKREMAEHTRRPGSDRELLTTGLRGACTALYASPQQKAGEDPDPRDDVHALGVIWHQLTTGDLTKGRPGGGRPWRRRLIAQGATPELIDLLVSCCEDEIGDRPEDAAALAEELARLLKPVVTPRPAATFNALLREAGIPPGEVRLIRHQDPRAAKGRTPYELWRDKRPQFEWYQATQRIDNRKKLTAPYWAVFLATPSGKTLFVGIYGVRYRGLLEHDTPMPHMEGMNKAGSCDVYDLTLLPALGDLAGKLYIDWGPGARAWVQYADRRDKSVTELRTEFANE